MQDTGYFSLFLIGFLGGTHCFGMCGGIVGAMSMGGEPRPILHLAYNFGRILSYGVAGAIVGALGGASIAFSGQLPVRVGLFVVANLMLVALGVYLTGATRVLAFAEGAGRSLWRHVQPLTRRYLPVQGVAQAFPLGLLWGWLPCGLVYSALLTALTSGSVWRGMGLMLAFGIGTLPNLLLAGLFAARLKRFASNRLLRFCAGTLVMGFGLHGLYSAIFLIAHA